MNKIKLLGVRNIPIDESEEIKPNTDYLIELVAQREGVFEPDSQGEETEPITYSLRVSHYKNIVAMETAKPINFEQGYSESQKTRFAIEQALEECGIGNEEDRNYKKFNEWLREKLNNEESRDKLFRAVGLERP